MPDPDADTVFGRIVAAAEQQPSAPCWTEVDAAGTTPWARSELLARALGLADVLRGEGVKAGDLVAFVVPHCVQLPIAWLAAVSLGAVPTILAEPSVRMPADAYAEMMRHLLGYLEPRLVLGSSEKTVTAVRAALPDARRCLDLDTVAGARSEAVRAPPALTADAVVALQHSSGTTGRQKGVLMSNRQVLAQLESYGRALAIDPARDRIASWLPLYHDMGFIAALLLPLVTGVETVQMSPFYWVSKPWRLPQVVSERRCTLSWLPNFAFHLLAARCDVARLEGLDLSCWRQVIDCSEPCTASALDRFLARFQPYGLSRSALGASYAMAETIFAVTEGGVRRPLVRRTVDGPALRGEGRVADTTDAGGLPLVGCGRPIEGIEVQVRDDAGGVKPADVVGELWVRGGFLMSGYFRRPEQTAAAVVDGWYKTGDLGCLAADGEVFVVGRSKDLLIIGGINIYPQDIEELVSQVPDVVPGRVVAIGRWSEELGTQRLVVMAETELSDEEARGRLNVAIRAKVGAYTEVQVSDVRLYPRNVLRKSTSGKLSRAMNAKLLEEER